MEDDVFIADIYKKKFVAAGFETVNVANGKDVLRVAGESRFDLVLLDLVLPEMSGKDVLRELRTGSGYDKDLRIVVFSNLSSGEDRDECIALGADGFISKTEFTPSEVVEEVKRFLRQSRERDLRERHPGSGGVSDEEHGNAGADGKRILFIEDEEVFVDMFGTRLQEEGYEVSSATDGAPGLEAALSGEYDLLISDIMMPGMDGTELVGKIREEKSAEELPIFLLSASVDEERFREIADSGMVERIFIKTEMTPSALADEVNRFLAGRKKETGEER